MKKIVVYCDERASEKRISAFLRTKGYQPAAAADMDAAAELCADAEGAVFVFFSEKPCEAVRRAAENAEIVAVVQAAERENAERFFGAGAVVLTLPVQPVSLLQAIRVTSEMNAKLRALGSENERLRSELSDMKLVYRAKCALIEYLGMTEREAHRYIEKQSMDGRVSRRETALRILKIYET